MVLSTLFKALCRGRRRVATQRRPVRARAPQLESLENRVVPTGNPFRQTTDTNLGIPIQRPGLPDLQPSILHTPNAGDRTFQMWWLGEYRPGDADLPPFDLHTTDRIYYSHSANGDTWSTPRVVLKGVGGTNGPEAADDHLLGSPSVLKVGNKYYMYYEAYATWSTVVNRFWSHSRSDNWITDGRADFAGNLVDWHPSYAQFEGPLGFAPAFRKFGTHPVYSGEVTFPDGKIDRFLRQQPTPLGCDGSGCWRQLNGGKPILWLYDGPAEGRTALYSCWQGDSNQRNTWATTDSRCDSVPRAQLVEVLGYVSTALNTPDMIGSLQNRVMLATSTDGINWTRFRGAARGGAVVAPLNELSNLYPHNCGQEILVERWDIHRAYGSGFPVALERDGYLELYFTDDSLRPLQTCVYPPVGWRIRIPFTQLENAQAYTGPGLRQNNASYGGDMKWSPLHQRYFAVYVNQQLDRPRLVWSDQHPNPNLPPTFPNDQTGWPQGLDVALPADRVGTWGGIAGDALGHTLDFTAANPVYTAFHLYYSNNRRGGDLVFDADLGHSLIFGYPTYGEIRGHVFNDLNGNGQRDAGEGGLPGVDIYLDLNDNGRLDGNEPRNRTDGAGNYRLADREPGRYLVRMVPPPGWMQSYPAGGYHSVAVGVGQTVSGRDFGAFQPVGRPLVVDGTAAADTLVLQDRPGDSNWYEVWRNGQLFLFGRWVTVSDLLLRGGNGDDRITLQSARYVSANIPARLEGGDGNDTLIGGDGYDTLDGGDGHDVLHGQGADNVYYGGRGNDTMVGSAGVDVMDGGPGNDSLTGNGSLDILLGGEGDDYLTGDEDDDVLVGGDGSDLLLGGIGNDLLIAGINGPDLLLGGAGDDVLIAGFTVFDDAPAMLWVVLYDPYTSLAPNETVFSNGAGNTLLGEEGLDTFFAYLDWDETDWDEKTEVLVSF